MCRACWFFSRSIFLSAILLAIVALFVEILSSGLGDGHWSNHISSNQFLNSFEPLARQITQRLTYMSSPSESYFSQVSSVEAYGDDADTTVVILNWQRLENVILIAKTHCSLVLNNVMSTIFIWNNNPNVTLNHDTFRGTGCAKRSLRIFNSPKNMFFLARFMACAQSSTPYCFIQDDDYLILPSIVHNMHAHFSKEADLPSLHLLPPHEHLSSRLRTLFMPERGIFTSFAWLGHGTYLRRSAVVAFVDLLTELNLTVEEQKMADNYFTILANRIPEVWFDHGIELSGSDPFTVGTEGSERNEHHITNALRYLLSTKKNTILQRSSYAAPGSREEAIISQAPCRLTTGIVSSNIKMLPKFLTVITADSLRTTSLFVQRLGDIGVEAASMYIRNPLSHLVDGLGDTSFESPYAAANGDWFAFDTLKVTDSNSGSVELAFLVDKHTSEVVKSCEFSKTTDGGNWVHVLAPVTCNNILSAANSDSGFDPNLQECSIPVITKEDPSPAQLFKVFLRESIAYKWKMYEIWLRRVAFSN